MALPAKTTRAKRVRRGLSLAKAKTDDGGCPTEAFGEGGPVAASFGCSHPSLVSLACPACFDVINNGSRFGCDHYNGLVFIVEWLRDSAYGSPLRSRR